MYNLRPECIIEYLELSNGMAYKDAQVFVPGEPWDTIRPREKRLYRCFSQVGEDYSIGTFR